MPIDSTSVNNNSLNYYYSNVFKTLVRSEKEHFFNRAAEHQLTESRLIQMFKYDFYALLRELEVPKHLWWANAFINNVTNPQMNISEMKVVYLISEQDLAQSVSRTNTELA